MEVRSVEKKNVRSSAVDEGVVRSIPVKTRMGDVIFEYDLGNLFNKHGNEDGNNYALLELAYRIMGYIEKETGLECETANTVHNEAAIEVIVDKEGHVLWKNRWEAWSDDPEYVEQWNALPESVKKALRKLAQEGIVVESIFGY